MTIKEWNPEEKEEVLELLQFFVHLFWNLADPVLETIGNGRFMFLVHRILLDSPPIPESETDTACRIIEEHTRSTHIPAIIQNGYVQLFINDAGKIPAPLYESCYQSGSLMGSAATKMDHRLKEQGLSIQTTGNEPPDHLAVELEFLIFLLIEGWQDNRSDRLNEAGRFAGETLSPFLRRIQDRLNTEPRFPLYTGLVQVLRILVETIAQKLTPPQPG